MKRILLIAFIVGIVIPLNANAGWWDRDFEKEFVSMGKGDGSGNWGNFGIHSCNPHTPWHFGVVGGGHPRRAGAKSFRFDNRAGQMRGSCNYHLSQYGERTEISPQGLEQPGSEAWYTWSVYHKDFRMIDNIAATHGQFKALDGHQYLMFRMDSNRGMVANFDVFEDFNNAKVIIPKNQLSNKWNDIRVHAKWSTGADGLVQIWVNGVLKVNRKGRNMLSNSPILFRFGIYKSDVNRASNNHNQVVYYDEVMRGNSCKSVSQFMSCPGQVNPPNNTGGRDDSAFSKYVDMWGDLIAAYNRNSGGKSKAEWGHWHYCTYGKNEGRTGLTPAHCATGASVFKPKNGIKTNVSEIVGEAGERGGDRFTSEITNGVRDFSNVAILNGNVFSFKDYHTFTAYETRKNRGLMLGFSKNTGVDGDVIAPIGVGWLFDNFAVMVANDNSIMGYKAEGIFDFKDPNTTYVDIGHRKQLSDKIVFYNDIIYAFGRSKPGELVKMSNIHALGFESKLTYTPTDEHKFIFTFDMPLHVERGSSQFIVSQLGTLHELNIDMVPDGRQMNFGMNHIYQLTEASNFTTKVSYTDDVDHRRGTSGYLAMVKYNISF